MSILIGLIGFLLVLVCILLILLVLIQLPKKEAGMGAAFGGGAADALFGAGSGNALTKMTKYTAGVFFVLVIIMSLIQSRRSVREDEVAKEFSKPVAAPKKLINTNSLLVPIEGATPTNAAPQPK